MAEGYVLNEATGQMEYRTDIEPGTRPDVFIKLQPGTPQDRVPVEDFYADQYNFNNERAYERLTVPSTPLLDSLTGAPAPARGSAPPSTPPVAVDMEPEALARNAEAARALPMPQAREQLAQDLKEPSVRGAVNSILSTVTGGVLSLDAIDAHLQAEAEGKPSPLAAKLRSSEALKLLDPAGNTAEALVREQLKREGTLPPELQERVAGTIGTLAALLTPMGGGRKAAKVSTDILMNSMFSNPATHSANVLSNALVAAWVPIVERPLAAIASGVEHAITGAPRGVFMGEAPASLFGMVMSTMDAIAEGARAAWTGKSLLGESLMKEVLTPAERAAQQRPLYRYGPEGLRPVERELKDDTVIGQGIGWWGTLLRLPTRALGAEDAVFKTWNHQAEIYASAYREAARTGDLSFTNLKRLVENPDASVALRADQFALTQTFQRELGELGPVFGKIGEIGTGIQDFTMGALPLGRLLVPVLRTPVNLSWWVTERTPLLGFLSKTLREDIAAGGALRSQAIAKQAGGTLLFGTMAYLANAGVITGHGPTNRVLQKQQEDLTGRLPYSVRIGDRFFSYDRLSPLGSLIGIAADFAEIGGQMPEHGIVEIGQAAALAVSRNIVSKTWLGDISDFFEAAKGDTSALARLVRNGLLKPIPGASRAARRFVDTTARETDPGAPIEQGEWREVRHLMNEYIAQTPGYSRSLPPRLNLFGDPILVPSGYGIDMLSPVFTSAAKNDRVGDEIIRLGKAGFPVPGRAPRVILGKDPDAHPIDQPANPLETGIELTASEYHDFQKLAAGIGMPKGLMTLHESLTELLKDDRYKKGSDAKRSTLIMGEVAMYRDAAEKLLLKQHPGLMETWKERQRAKAGAFRAPRDGAMVPFKPHLTPAQ